MFKGGLGNIMQQAQKMQEEMQRMQEELANAKVVGESGGGLVAVTMTGRHDVTDVKIDDSVLKEEKELLEDLLAAAVNDAVRKIEAANKDKMSGMMGGLGLPEGFKFPFS